MNPGFLFDPFCYVIVVKPNQFIINMISATSRMKKLILIFEKRQLSCYVVILYEICGLLRKGWYCQSISIGAKQARVTDTRRGISDQSGGYSLDRKIEVDEPYDLCHHTSAYVGNG